MLLVCFRRRCVPFLGAIPVENGRLLVGVVKVVAKEISTDEKMSSDVRNTHTNTNTPRHPALYYSTTVHSTYECMSRYELATGFETRGGSAAVGGLAAATVLQPTIEGSAWFRQGVRACVRIAECVECASGPRWVRKVTYM